MSAGGSTSVPDMTLGLQLLAQVIDRSLRLANGKRVAWALVLQVGEAAQYVSNCERADGLALVEEMLATWRAEDEAAKRPDAEELP